MKVYVVWRMHHAPLEVFTKHRKAEALVVLLERDGIEAFVEPCTLNEAAPVPEGLEVLGSVETGVQKSDK